MWPGGVGRFIPLFSLPVYERLARMCTAVGALLGIAVEGCGDLLTLMV